MTASELINGCLRLIGQLAEGETPSAETSADALSAINQMIDSWEGLNLYSTTDQAITWPATYGTRTLGTTGQLVGTRPDRLEESTYFIEDGKSFQVRFISEAEYNAIPSKTNTSNHPSVLFVNYTMPNLTLSVYPVPTVALSWHFIGATRLTQPATLATVLSVPPGYLRAFRFNAAVEIAAEFGVQAPPDVRRIAASSMLLIKRGNTKIGLMDLPYPLASGGRSDIFAG